MKENDRTLAGRDILVIDQNGEQLGVLPFAQALLKAKEATLDLVMVADQSDPPVCRIMDFGRLVYDQKRRVREQKKQHHAQKLKEVKFRLRIDDHDYRIKIQHALDFLDKGDKLKVTIMFRGREMAYKQMGFDLITRVIADLDGHGRPEVEPKLLGRNLAITFAATKGHRH